MGANAQTSVPLYVAAEVLTAADMNISAGTGVPVFSTTVTRDAAFGGAGEKVLAEGQLAYIEASDVVQYYTGSAWATVGPIASGLTLVTPTSITSTGGTVTQTGGKVNIAGSSSVSLNGVFTSTYQNYLVLFDSVKISAGNISIFARLRVGGTDTTSGTYYAGQVYGTYAGAGGAGGVNGGTSWAMFGAGTTEQQMASLQIFAPQATQKTTYVSLGVAEDALSHWAGYQSGATSFDGFTFFSASGNYSGNITVYGYQKS